MGAVGTIWTAFKAGIILLLASRYAAKLDSSGDFVNHFVLLLAFILILAVIREEFLTALPPRLSQFDLLRSIIMGISSFVVLFIAYVLSAQLTDWFEKNFMNGPHVLELAIIVVLVIFVLTVVGLLFVHNAGPRPKDVEHALRIANIALASVQDT